jgi:hypothetical protein
MKKEGKGQNSIYRTKIKNLIEMYNFMNPLNLADKQVKSALKFFSETYSIDNRNE